jgi:predicted dehydrogenase
VLGDFNQVHGLLKSHYTRVPVIDVSNGQVIDPAHPKTSPDHIFVHGTLEGDAVASIAFRKPRSAADNTGFRWYITGTDGEIVITVPEEHWQFGLGEGTSLKLKVGKAEQAENVEWMSGSSPGDKVPSPGTNTARLYESFAKGKGVEATFESALKTHLLLERIAKSAGWEL